MKGIVKYAVSAATGLTLLAAACGQATPQDIMGVLQAIEGKQLVIQQDDGTTIRIQAKDDKPVAEAKDLVGHEVKIEVKVKGEVRDLVAVKATESIIGTLKAIEGKELVVKSDDGATSRIQMKDDKPGAEIRDLVGHEVRASVTMKATARTLVEIKRADDVLGVVRAVEDRKLVIQRDDGTTVRVLALEDRPGAELNDLIGHEIKATTVAAGSGRRLVEVHKTEGVLGTLQGVEDKNLVIRRDDGTMVRVQTIEDRPGAEMNDLIGHEIKATTVSRGNVRAMVAVSKTESVVGKLQGIEDKNLVIKRDDGSTVRVQMMEDRPAAELRDLMGHEVKASSTGKGNVRNLADIQKTQSIVGTVKAVEDKALVIQKDDGTTVRLQTTEDKPSAELKDLVGHQVKASATSKGSGKSLVKVEKTEVVLGKVKAVEDKVLIIQKADGTTVRIATEDRPGAELKDLVNHEVKVTTTSAGDMVKIEHPKPEAPAAAEDFHFSGAVQSITANAMVIGGRTFQVDQTTVRDAGLAVGTMAQVHFTTLAGGTLRAIEVETAAPDDVAKAAKAAPAAAEDFHFSGTLQSKTPDTMVVGGKTFKVNQATLLDAGVAQGALAKVEFVTLADGSLLATKIEAEAADDAAKAKLSPAGVAEDFHFPGAVQSIGPDLWLVGGRTFRVNQSTMLDSGLAVGATATVEFVMQPDGTALATKIETGAAEDKPKAGVAEDLGFAGVVQSKTANTMVIGGKTFKVDQATLLDAGLNQGAIAKVEFVTLPDGSLLAKKIETEAADDAAKAKPSAAGVVEDFHFNGVIQTMGANTWMVSGRTFKVDAATMLDSGLKAGAMAKVEFITMPDGTAVATKIETSAIGVGIEDKPKQPVAGQPASQVLEDFNFSGIVASISPSAWVIGGRTFNMNQTTIIDTGVTLGVMVKVKFVVLPDGSTLATKIETAVAAAAGTQPGVDIKGPEAEAERGGGSGSGGSGKGN